MWGGRMTSSATARARARRQLQHSGEVAVPQIQPRKEPESGSHLRVVPQPARRRGNVPRATLVVFTLTVFTIAVVVFQATIAEQQLRLDALTQDLRFAESHYDNLRQERAELLSPSRLREEAVMMGMYQGLSTKFVEVQSQVVAEVMASTAKMNPLFADPPAGVASAGALAQMQPVEVANRP
jgi:cell division protein FtsL